MAMDYLLHCCLAISEEQVDSLAAQAAAAKSRAKPLGQAHHVLKRIGINVRQVWPVLVGYDQEVPRIYRLDIHEHGALVVTMEKGGG